MVLDCAYPALPAFEYIVGQIGDKLSRKASYFFGSSSVARGIVAGERGRRWVVL